MEMNTKKLSKIVITLFTALLIVSLVVPVFAAVSPNGYTGDGSKTDTSSIDNLGQDVIKIVSTAGAIISVVVLIVLGIKYMMGSAEEKAEYKKTLLPYIIGAAFVFAATTIATIIFNFSSTISA